MDEQARTIFCGNLSNEVTVDILYELFLQAGPIEKVSIPKDRDGRQRAFGFITYKHMNSVKYALNLFEGTTLYNRTLCMKPRYNAEAQVDNTASHSIHNMMQHQLLQQNMQNMHNTHNMMQFQSLQKNQLLQQTQQLALGNFPLLNTNSNDDKNLKRMHPYQRDRDKYRERDKIRDRDRDRDRERNRERSHNEHYRDERPHYNRDSNYHPNDYSRYNSNRKRWSYH